MSTKPADPYPVSALAALIHRVIDQAKADGHELGYAEIARRGIDLSRGNVRTYANVKQKRLLELEKRRGLALGLRVHPILVDRAIAEDLDLWLDGFNYDYRTDPELSRQDREQIESYIQAIKDTKGQGQRHA